MSDELGKNKTRDFARFDAACKHILLVPKAQIDKALEEEKKKAEKAEGGMKRAS